MDDINLKLSGFYTPRNTSWIRHNISSPSNQPKVDLCSTYFGRVYRGATYAAHFSSIDRSCSSSPKVNQFCVTDRAKLLNVLFKSDHQSLHSNCRKFSESEPICVCKLHSFSYILCGVICLR